MRRCAVETGIQQRRQEIKIRTVTLAALVFLSLQALYLVYHLVFCFWTAVEEVAMRSRLERMTKKTT